jgi:phosphoglycerate dehydrogenase-like enzyme
MSTFVACLDVWDPAVREVVKRVAPAELDLHFASTYDDAEQYDLAEQAEVILAGWAAIPASMLQRARKLRFIEKWGIGVDRIDIASARHLGIPVAITAGSNANAVAEHAVMLMLAVNRRVTQVDRAMRDGIWLKAPMRAVCYQLTGKTVGIYGFGNIGRTVARLVSGFNCRIIYHDAIQADAATEHSMNATFVDFDTLLAESDVLSVHAPLTPKTQKSIGMPQLAKMKSTALLINTARGEIVDEHALFDALSAGRLRGAGLDAFDPEPPSADHPLLTLDQVIATPHTGGAVFDNVENVAQHAIGNILKFLHGEPLAPVDVIVPTAQDATVSRPPAHAEKEDAQ